MGSEPLAENRYLAAMKDWMNTEGIKTLWDLTLCENDEWRRWKHLEVPPNLANEYVFFLSQLKGKAPLNRRKADIRGWVLIPGNTLFRKDISSSPATLMHRPIRGLGRGSGL